MMESMISGRYYRMCKYRMLKKIEALRIEQHKAQAKCNILAQLHQAATATRDLRAFGDVLNTRFLAELVEARAALEIEKSCAAQIEEAQKAIAAAEKRFYKELRGVNFLFDTVLVNRGLNDNLIQRGLAEFKCSVDPPVQSRSPPPWKQSIRTHYCAPEFCRNCGIQIIDEEFHLRYHEHHCAQLAQRTGYIDAYNIQTGERVKPLYPKQPSYPEQPSNPEQPANFKQPANPEQRLYSGPPPGPNEIPEPSPGVAAGARSGPTEANHIGNVAPDHQSSSKGHPSTVIVDHSEREPEQPTIIQDAMKDSARLKEGLKQDMNDKIQKLLMAQRAHDSLRAIRNKNELRRLIERMQPQILSSLDYEAEALRFDFEVHHFNVERLNVAEQEFEDMVQRCKKAGMYDIIPKMEVEDGRRSVDNGYGYEQMDEFRNWAIASVNRSTIEKWLDGIDPEVVLAPCDPDHHYNIPSQGGENHPRFDPEQIKTADKPHIASCGGVEEQVSPGSTQLPTPPSEKKAIPSGESELQETEKDQLFSTPFVEKNLLEDKSHDVDPSVFNLRNNSSASMQGNTARKRTRDPTKEGEPASVQPTFKRPRLEDPPTPADSKQRNAETALSSSAQEFSGQKADQVASKEAKDSENPFGDDRPRPEEESQPAIPTEKNGSSNTGRSFVIGKRRRDTAGDIDVPLDSSHKRPRHGEISEVASDEMLSNEGLDFPNGSFSSIGIHESFSVRAYAEWGDFTYRKRIDAWALEMQKERVESLELRKKLLKPGDSDGTPISCVP
ncbi:hypothetical protein SLS60_002221 [Paraconiothyrium brasiliense]|uniref:Uncharacterized protein n=1 Tax=Paraconiothyrium brasiliense TaxID=300254 RepID=A0ABR3S1P9_9PLEO